MSDIETGSAFITGIDHIKHTHTPSTEMIDRIAGHMVGEHTKIEKILDSMDKDHPDWDIYYQVKKDIARFVQELEHTKSLIDLGDI